jgi:hypothetical protein
MDKVVHTTLIKITVATLLKITTSMSSLDIFLQVYLIQGLGSGAFLIPGSGSEVPYTTYELSKNFGY